MKRNVALDSNGNKAPKVFFPTPRMKRSDIELAAQCVAECVADHVRSLSTRMAPEMRFTVQREINGRLYYTMDISLRDLALLQSLRAEK